MKRFVTGAVLLASLALAGSASAAPGLCSMTGFGEFDCDVAFDGSGLTFGLPDGRTFAFTLDDADKGTAFLIGANARPGQRPEEIRGFAAIEGRAGCWARGDDLEFCVLVSQ